MPIIVSDGSLVDILPTAGLTGSNTSSLFKWVLPRYRKYGDSGPHKKQNNTCF